MIKDITIGQYFPGNSIIHRLDPRMKILLTLCYIVLLFVADNLFSFIPAVGLLVFVVLQSRIKAKLIFKSMKPILPLILFTSILNMFFLDGQVLLQLGPIRLTVEGILLSVKIALRILCLIVGTSLLTYTTSPTALTDALERLLHPLKKIRFPVHEMAMMMTIALRFIPTLVEETDRIISAQKARGADFETGNLIQRAKALLPILIPLFVSAIRRAGELAMAMECRCYHGGDNRTRMRQLSYHGTDFAALGVIAAVLAMVIAINLWMPVLW